MKSIVHTNFIPSFIVKFAVPVLTIYLAYYVGTSVASNNYNILYLLGMSAYLLAVLKDKIRALYLLLFFIYLIPQYVEFYRIGSHVVIKPLSLAFIIISISFLLDKISVTKQFRYNKKIPGATKFFLFLWMLTGIFSVLIPLIKVFLIKAGFIQETLYGVYSQFFTGSIVMFGSIVIALFIPEVVNSEEKIIKLFNSFILIGYITSVVGWLEHLFDIAYWNVVYPGRLEFPNTGNSPGELLIIPICWSFQQFINQKKKVYLFSFIFFLLTTILSLTRSNILAISFILFIIAYLQRTITIKIRGIILSFIILAFLATGFVYTKFILPPNEVSRITSAGAVISRFLTQQYSIMDFLKRDLASKIVGSGYQTSQSYRMSPDERGNLIMVVQSMHNQFFRILMDHGVIGLISILGIITLTLFNCIKVRKYASQMQKVNLMATSNTVIGSILGWSIMWFSSISCLTFMLFFMLGLSISLKNIAINTGFTIR